MDPYVVLWLKCRDWDLSVLPDDRVVLRFDITDFRQPFWIVAEREAGAELSSSTPALPRTWW